LDIFLNFGLAWISVLLAIFLAVAYLTRKAIIRIPSKREFFIRLNKNIRKHHKLIGVALILTGLIHGIFSSDKLFSINWGTALWIVSILLGISWMLRKKITGRKSWMLFHRLLVILFSVSIFIHVIDAGGIQVFSIIKSTGSTSVEEPYDMGDTSPTSIPPTTETTTESPVTESPSPTTEAPVGNVYKDGTYTGEATGFQPGLIVNVNIKDNEIISVEVIDHNEVNSRYWSTPVEYIPDWIVDSQSTDVDTISGATFTSTGIINAVNDALRQALVSGAVPDDLSLPYGRRH
jgi:uncharacterized protein with FMN-binding domain